MELKISEVQPFSLHDGPGIRTTIFLSGCPLRCVWCHNPETQSEAPQLLFDVKKCIGCALCGQCAEGGHCFEGAHHLHRERCTMCGKCIKLCPTHALSSTVRLLDEKAFVELIEKQQRVAGRDGGITFSGGEPLLQGETVLQFLRLTDIHRAIETCGYAEEDLFCRVIEQMDYVMFDLKIADAELHKTYTGVSNALILKNLQHLRASGKPFVLRTPLIPGITDTKENLEAIREIAKDNPWQTLDYNVLTPAKYERLGKAFSLSVQR